MNKTAATEFLSEWLENHLNNATSQEPIPYSRIVWVYGEERDRNAVLSKLIPKTHEGDSCVLDDVAGIGHIRRLVWFEPLDMCALPKSTNFHMATMVRLEDAVLRRLKDIRGPYLRELDAAKRSMALGFPGNVRERAGALDPENYAIAVQESTRAQVMGASQVAQAVEEAAKTLYSGLKINPLFVYPITNLEFGFEWLREILPATKVLTSPRLVFVLTSDEVITRCPLGIDVRRYVPIDQMIEVKPD